MPPSGELLVYRTANQIEARALAAALEEGGVDAHVLGEALQGGYGGVFAGGLNELEVWINADDRDRAEQIIADWRDHSATEPPPDAPKRSGLLPEKIQFPMIALLWIMTAVAILAAATSKRLIGFGDWPMGLLVLLSLTLTWLMMRKAWFTAFRMR